MTVCVCVFVTLHVPVICVYVLMLLYRDVVAAVDRQQRFQANKLYYVVSFDICIHSWSIYGQIPLHRLFRDVCNVSKTSPRQVGDVSVKSATCHRLVLDFLETSFTCWRHIRKVSDNSYNSDNTYFSNLIRSLFCSLLWFFCRHRGP